MVVVALVGALAAEVGGLVEVRAQRVRATPATRTAAAPPAPWSPSPWRTSGGASLFGPLSVRLRLPAAAPAAAAEFALPAVGSPAPASGDGLTSGSGDVAVVPPPPNGFGERPKAATAPPPQLQASQYGDTTPSGGTWALLIGINDYPGLRYDLRYAVNDVNDVNEALRRRGVTNDRRMVLRDRQATAAVIRAGLDWLTSHAGPDATIVFFYAGHIQKLGGTTEALVGADGEVVTDAEVAALLDRSPATRSWIGLAACYAAGFSELVEPGRIVTAAASPDDLAYENQQFGRSYLVEYMVRRAMLGAGVTTVEAAFARATAELQRDHPDRVPVQFDEFEGDLDLTTAPPADEPPPPSSSNGGPPPSSPPPPSRDGCAELTVGVVRCSS